MRNRGWFFFALLAALLAARLCHMAILWEGDAYPLAAARQMAHGKMLYRDIWFDKPPVLPAVYLLWGASDGVPLRIAGALYALLICVVAYGFARQYWSEREGVWAAALCGFFLIFDFPSSAIPVASDLLMVAPHIAAVWMAWKRRPLLSGVLAGLVFWINPKGLLVAAVCAAWDPRGIPWMAAGFAAVSGAALAWLGANGAIGAWWEEVWTWGRLYAGSTFVEAPIWNGLVRTLGWIGFHIAAVVAAAWFAWKDRRSGIARWIVWLAAAVLGVAAGLRFFPRYYFLLLPVVVLMASRGLALLPQRRAMLVAALLAIPLVRFGPSYIAAADNADWRDTAMDRDSRAAAVQIRKLAKPGDTLLVWGYRPELYVYTGLPAATMYIDTQVLTGVPADRHLTDSRPVETERAAERRRTLAQSSPAFIVDGIGPYNPQLAIGQYPELRDWLAKYRAVARIGGTVIYQRAPPWCQALPRPEYRNLERVPAADPWFDVYRVAPGVFAIYEPHQSEETIGYLITGKKQALLFDTGMGIGDVKKVTAGLTDLPVVVLNSHTHDDHVGGNWQFDTVYGMDMAFTRANAQGSREDAQAEIAPGEICGDLPAGFDRQSYATRPWKIAAFKHDGDRIELGARTLEIIATPGHTPDAISLFDRGHGLLFTGDTYYPAPIWLYRPETDLDAYARSIKRLAALEPQVRLVLGAHNIPVAPPSILPRLVSAFEAVRSGRIPPTPESPGKVLYKVDDISFLMAAPKPKR